MAQTGWGVIEISGQRYRPVSFGMVKTAASDELGQRIHYIASSIGTLAEKYKADMVGMEDIFFTKNISSAIPVAKVIGAIIHQVSSQQIPARLFSPPQIKTTITGYGNADKNQMQEMVRIMLELKEIPRPNHSADALAAALCCATFIASEKRLGG